MLREKGSPAIGEALGLLGTDGAARGGEKKGREGERGKLTNELIFLR